MVRSLKNIARRWYARAISDKRPCPEYSWRWLNRLAADLCWKNQGAAIRPQYAWGAVFAAAQAKALGHPEVTLIELGVAGGRGLLALQEVAEAVSARIPVRPRVYGFDMGSGLPDVTDLRDLPQIWKAGDYKMDFGQLKSKLHSGTELIIGPITETLARFIEHPHPPAGFVSFDMDLYTSTRDALKLLFHGDLPAERCLPRVICYMDDIMGVSFGDLTGERLAIKEYNESGAPLRGIYPVYGLRYDLAWPQDRAQWPDMMFWAHFLDHPEYGAYDGLVPFTEAPI
jgi:hypothetical protein